MRHSSEPLDHAIAPKSVGAWSGRLQRRPTAEAIEVVRELDHLGYRAVWVPESPFGKDVLTFSAVLLGGSTRITIATGIANIWARDPAAMMNAGRTLGDAHPGRFVLGLGISHESTARARGHEYHQPLMVMRTYLQRMHDTPFDGDGPSWTPPLIIAALGPRMLEVAAQLTDGAHPFLATPEHTAQARQTLGVDRLLAVEQGIVLGTPKEAVVAARTHLARFLVWPNYQRHLLRMGFTEDDLVDDGSDRLVKSLYAIGDEDAARRRVKDHLDAGADHVCIQVVANEAEQEMEAYRRLAPVLTETPVGW